MLEEEENIPLPSSTDRGMLRSSSALLIGIPTTQQVEGVCDATATELTVEAFAAPDG